MLSDNDEQTSQLAANVRSGSVVAAAGCGKTEQIARATQVSTGRRLILTHTHAGVDALRTRLKKRGVPDSKYRIDTIAGWSLRFASSYPVRSGIPVTKPSGKEWNTIYECATTLVRSGAITDVLKASYDGLFVDEYQDCTLVQHEIVRALVPHFPTCVFGDPLQAIFDFKGQTPVDWETEVFPVFPVCETLTRPWRWENASNQNLADWLRKVRSQLENGQPVNLANSPDCVQWIENPLPAKSPEIMAQRQTAVSSALKSAHVGDDQKLIVITDSANVKGRAKLASRLSRFGCTNIEPIDCPDLFELAAALDSCSGMERLECALATAAACMTGISKTALIKAVQSHLNGRKLGAKNFGDVIPLCIDATHASTSHSLLKLFSALYARTDTRPYRREMFYSLCSALRLMTTGQFENLTDAVWEAQNHIRHRGRVLAKRSIGSTLLIKGLEFDHAIIIDAPNLDKKHLYVALTRATRSLVILSPSEQIIPKADKGS